jgi:hypothetical protein
MTMIQAGPGKNYKTMLKKITEEKKGLWTWLKW